MDQMQVKSLTTETNASQSRTTNVKKLSPKQPPGRTNRLARAFSAEILRLRREGYSLVAIQEALADVGVVVSKSTVQREAARRPRQPAASSTRPEARHAAKPPASATSVSSSPAGDPPRGKDVAEAFYKDRFSNPLITRRAPDEDSRH